MDHIKYRAFNLTSNEEILPQTEMTIDNINNTAMEVVEPAIWFRVSDKPIFKPQIAKKRSISAVANIEEEIIESRNKKHA